MDPDVLARQAAAALAELTGVRRTRRSSCSAPAGRRPRTAFGEPRARVPDDRGARLRGARSPRGIAARRVVRRGRRADAGAARPDPPLRGPRAPARSCTASGPPRPRAARRRCSPTPTGRCAPTGRSARRAGPRPPEPDRDLAAGRVPRFVDLTDCWSPRLRALARELDPSLAEAVYAWLRGPHYETCAEAEWVRRIGADVLGMSTVPEAIAARECGIEVLGLSTVTAVEGDDAGIDPSEVVVVAEAAAARIGPLLADLVRRGTHDHDDVDPDAGRHRRRGAADRGQRHQRDRRVRAQGHARPGCSGRGAPRTSRCSRSPTARSCSASGSSLWQALVAAVVGAVRLVPAGRPGLDRRQARLGADPGAVPRAVRALRQQPARRGVLPAAGRLGDRAGRAVDAGDRDRLRAARLERRQRHQGGRVRGGRGGDRAGRDPRLRRDHAAAEVAHDRDDRRSPWSTSC